MGKVPQVKVRAGKATYTIKDMDRNGKASSKDVVLVKSRGRTVKMKLDRFLQFTKSSNLMGSKLSAVSKHIRSRFAPRSKQIAALQKYRAPTKLASMMRRGKLRFIPKGVRLRGPRKRTFHLTLYQIRKGDIKGFKWACNNRKDYVVIRHRRSGELYVIRRRSAEAIVRMYNRGPGAKMLTMKTLLRAIAGSDRNIISS